MPRMLHCLYMSFLTMLFLEAPAVAQKFDGEPILRPIDGTVMELTQDFSFIDKTGTVWKAPKGHRTDGASIPRALWSIVGSPFTGRYLHAAIIHDVYCDLKSRDWRSVHRTFYDAMIANGVTDIQARIMYFAVARFGPRWVTDAKLSCPLGYHCFSPTPVYVTLAINPVVDVEELRAGIEIIESANLSPADIEKKADAAFLNGSVGIRGKERQGDGRVRQLDQVGNYPSALNQMLIR